MIANPTVPEVAMVGATLVDGRVGPRRATEAARGRGGRKSSSRPRTDTKDRARSRSRERKSSDGPCSFAAKKNRVERTRGVAADRVCTSEPPCPLPASVAVPGPWSSMGEVGPRRPQRQHEGAEVGRADTMGGRFACDLRVTTTRTHMKCVLAGRRVGGVYCDIFFAAKPQVPLLLFRSLLRDLALSFVSDPGAGAALPFPAS